MSVTLVQFELCYYNNATQQRYTPEQARSACSSQHSVMDVANDGTRFITLADKAEKESKSNFAKFMSCLFVETHITLVKSAEYSDTLAQVVRSCKF